MGAIRLVLILCAGNMLAGCRSPAPGFFPLAFTRRGSHQQSPKPSVPGFTSSRPRQPGFLEGAASISFTSWPRSDQLPAGPLTPRRSNPRFGGLDGNTNLWAWYVADEPDLEWDFTGGCGPSQSAVKRFRAQTTAVVLYSGSEALDLRGDPGPS